MRNLLYLQFHSILYILLSMKMLLRSVKTMLRAHVQTSLHSRVHRCTAVSGFWVVSSKAACRLEPEHANLSVCWCMGR